MKKFLQFASWIALGLAVVAVILMIATPAIDVTVNSIGGGSTHKYINGTTALFGAKETYDFIVTSATSVTHAAPLAVVGWILLLVGAIVIVLGAVLPAIKEKLGKFAIALDLAAFVLLLLGGIFAFCVVASFYGANGYNSVPSGAAIGFGWVMSGILAILGALVTICPAASNLISKK